jgi:asparagine synthase (glutamine-hydrolysing)
MCGIAGWLGYLPQSRNYAGRMALALRHRGPDGSGVRSWPEATIVHTRLSIIDLSPAGAQPMANEDETVWTVFNGEIYNFRELRHDLEQRGHIFKGRSDGEVLPHLYEEEGSMFVTRLKGMFALAVYDKRTETLVLARDRFGIKPLFYAVMTHRLAFASEIKPLLDFPDIDDRPDEQAIHDYTALCYIPAPATFYKNIRALQPGELLEARLDQHVVSWTNRTYNKWSIRPNHKLTLAEATERAAELVTTAVGRQMESDVPLGALLSGGIDSSLVSFAAQAAGSSGIQTFNVRFSDKDYDETWAALAVAEHIGSRHETLDMDSCQGSWSHITDLLLHAGQPFADTSLFAVDAVCRLMRRHVTVALSGDGGDESFGGYRFYRRLALIAQLQELPSWLCRGAAVVLAPLAHMGIVQSHYPKRIQAVAGADDTKIIQDLFCSFPADEHNALCRDLNVLPLRRLFERQWEQLEPEKTSRVQRLFDHATEINIRLELANDFLYKVDTASMRQSLEVRVPMLDEDLFSFGLSLPHRLKVKGQTTKVVLRAVAGSKLPSAVAKKPKLGFGVPVDSWVDRNFKTTLKDTLLGPRSRLADYLNPAAYRPVVEAFCDQHPYLGLSRQGLYQRAIMLLSLQLALSRRLETSNRLQPSCVP